MSNPRYDEEFLKELFSSRSRETYARVIALTNDEKPTETLNGIVTQGNISLNGESSVRRTCSLSFVVDKDSSYSEYYWALTNKFKLEIGVKNDIDKKYDNIIYFPMGIYVITSFSASYSTNNFSISLQGQDKMCLLNGQVGGNLPSSVDFGTIEEKDENGVVTIRDYEIEEIIRQSVHEYAREPFHNILIKDLPKFGLFLLKYLGDSPLYAFTPVGDSSDIQNVTVKGDTIVYIQNEDESYTSAKIDGTTEGVILKYKTFNDLIDTGEPTTVYLNETDKIPYNIIKVDTGGTAGYRLTSLTYPRGNDNASGLVSGIGETLTSILDKIVSMLGDYEYFYDLDGQFVFQRKNRSIDTNWNTNVFNTTGLGNPYELMASLPCSWNFGQGELITSYSNNPNLQNVKNDFSIWGTRTSATGVEYPVHMRFAIDRKPIYYKTISISEAEAAAYKEHFSWAKNSKPQTSKVYYADGYEPATGEVATKVDWRELIYRMALDYRRYNQWDTFNAKIVEANGDRYPGGITGYEQYYIDLEGFWRQLYDPDDEVGTKQYKKITYAEAKDTEKTLYIKEDFTSNKGTKYCIDDGTYLNSVNKSKYYFRDYFDGTSTAILKTRWDYLVDIGMNSTYDYDKDGEEINENYRGQITNVVNNRYAFLVNAFEIESKDELPEEYENQDYNVYYTINATTNKKTYYCLNKISGLLYEVDISSKGVVLSNNKIVKLNYKYKDITFTRPMVLLDNILSNSSYSYNKGFYKYEGYSVYSKFEVPSDYIGDYGQSILFGSSTATKLSDLSDDLKTLYYDSDNNLKQYFQFKVNDRFCDPYYLDAESKKAIEKTEYGYFTTQKEIEYYVEEEVFNKSQTYYDEGSQKDWAIQVFESPESLNFWFDFLDSPNSEVDKFATKFIQDRPKATNDSNAKAIFYREALNLIYLTTSNEEEEEKLKPYVYDAYSFCQLPENMEQYFTVFNGGKSCKEVLDEYLYHYTYATQSVSISAIPIYYLDANNIITLQDNNTLINGNYVINSMSIPLNGTGTMSISATKMIDKLY